MKKDNIIGPEIDFSRQKRRKIVVFLEDLQSLKWRFKKKYHTLFVL